MFLTCFITDIFVYFIDIVTCLTEGNDRIRDTAGNNCKLVYNRIRDTVAPFLVTVTIGLYGYEANSGIRGCCQLVAGVRSAQPSK
jgi:hypothetical protein